MGEFLQANWLWLLLGIGLLWFLFRRGGCGMSGHGSHEGHGEQPAMKEGEKVSKKGGGCC